MCAEQYGPDFDNQPRSLGCGHTFCASCLMKLMTSRGVSCPVCNRFHTLSAPDVMLLPINYAVLDIVKNIDTQGQQSEVQAPLCGVCKTSPATVICVDCEPGSLYNFCDTCDAGEHARPFGPAQRHKRFPIDDPPIPGSSGFCSRHTMVAATLYSDNLDEFACQVCEQEADWTSRIAHFEPISETAQRLRMNVKKLTKYTNDIIIKLRDSKQNLDTIVTDLEPGAVAVKANITKTFSKCVEILQDRQKTLLANVDVEVSWFLYCPADLSFPKGFLTFCEHVMHYSMVEVAVAHLHLQ